MNPRPEQPPIGSSTHELHARRAAHGCRVGVVIWERHDATTWYGWARGAYSARTIEKTPHGYQLEGDGSYGKGGEPKLYATLTGAKRAAKRSAWKWG